MPTSRLARTPFDTLRGTPVAERRRQGTRVQVQSVGPARAVHVANEVAIEVAIEVAVEVQSKLKSTIHSQELQMTRKTLQDLFVHSLSDIYSAEKQLTRALGKLSRTASNEELSKAFQTHLEETQGQIERIDKVVESCGIRLKRIKCVAMEGLVEEGEELIDEIEKGPVLDAGLVGAAQKVEHYEIAAYGTLCALGKQLGFNDAVKLLQETLEEEKATDLKLTKFAEKAGNVQAKAA